MQLHCLGTTGYHPSADRQTACYCVPEAGLVLDAGSGIFRLPPLLQTDSIDLLLSHAHLDHVVGLTYFFDILYQHSLEEVRIWGAPEKLAAIRRHLFDEALFPLEPPFRWCPIEQDTFPLVGGGTVRPFALSHPGGALGYRIDWPSTSLAYVTDTVADPAAGYVQTIRGSQLLLHECYFRDAQSDWAKKTGHSWTSQAAGVAAAAEVDRLLLIHINPLETDPDPVGIETARAIHPATDVAHDGMVVPF